MSLITPGDNNMTTFVRAYHLYISCQAERENINTVYNLTTLLQDVIIFLQRVLKIFANDAQYWVNKFFNFFSLKYTLA
jgi:hypothetical protein